MCVPQAQHATNIHADASNLSLQAWLECMGGTRDRACSEAVPLQATLLTLLLSHSVLIQRDLISTLKAICLSTRSAPPRAANAGVVGPAAERSSEPQDPRTRPAKRHKPQPGHPATWSPSASIQVRLPTCPEGQLLMLDLQSLVISVLTPSDVSLHTGIGLPKHCSALARNKVLSRAADPKSVLLPACSVG